MSLKVRIFLWQLARCRMPSKDQIALRHGPSNGQCALCGGPEDANHIFSPVTLPTLFGVVLEFTSKSFGTWNPASLGDVVHILLSFHGKTRNFFRMLMAAVCWALWLICNKYSIEAKFPNQPADCIFKILYLLQLWMPLLKDDARPLLDELLSTLKALFDATYVSRRQTTP